MSIGANGLSNLDHTQVIRKTATETADGGLAQSVISLAGNLVPREYDQISLTYVMSGNGVGEVETATYRFDGDTVAILTLSYDIQNRLIDVVRS